MNGAVTVLGAGAWGTAVACHAAARHPVTLWARDPALVERMQRDRRNDTYLEGAALPESIQCEHDLSRALPAAGERDALVIVATPLAGLRPMLASIRALRGDDAGGVPLVWLCKGLERGSGLLPHQVAQAELPGARCGVVSGPSFAQEVAAGLPVALTAASGDDGVVDRAVASLHHGAARIYRSADVVGVEIGGALKNVMAIAAGICDGLKLGHNARAALITRGLAEITRFGAALGASPATFTGLAGLGDLVLTCTGDLSRNRRVGLAMAAGTPLAQVLADLGHVAEGVACADVVGVRGEELGVELPIVNAVRAVLAGSVGAREAVLALLAREPKREH